MDAKNPKRRISRSQVTQKGYRLGQAPATKGRTLPNRPLSHDDVDAVLESFSRTSPAGKRNRAIVQMLYRAEAKIAQVLGLHMWDYDPATGTVTLPGQQGSPDRQVALDVVARADLDVWLAARRKLGVTAAMAPLFCTVTTPVGTDLGPTQIRKALRDKQAQLGVHKRVNPESIRISRAHHRATETGRFEASVASYINAESFRARYPEAHRAWLNAHDLMETAPAANADMIGHACRRAINAFSDRLTELHNVTPLETGKTKAKIKAVFDAQAHKSRTVTQAAIALSDYWEALVTYWEAVSDLAQRQEHGLELAAEDSRRMVFQTMFVMREIDLALARMDQAGASS